MSYYTPITSAQRDYYDDIYKHMFDSSVTVEAAYANSVYDNQKSPAYTDYKISKTLAGVQAFIDAGRTYIGAVHRVVEDASNNGVYVIMNGGSGLEYRRVAFTEVQPAQSTTLNQYEAQNSFFTSVGDNHGNWSMDGPFEWSNKHICVNHLYRSNDGRYPMEAFLVADSLAMAIAYCSPIEELETGEYTYMSYPGMYISVVNDQISSNNGLYLVSGATYPDMRLVKLAFDQDNPAVSTTITIEQAENEYYELFPWIKKYLDSRRGKAMKREPVSSVYTALTGEGYPMEAYSVFGTFEAMQVWLYETNHSPVLSESSAYNLYPGKMVSVIGDPDSGKNGLYMVACDITTDQGSRWVFTNIRFMKMTNA